MRILVDMDGVIADFDGEFLKRWRERHPDKLFIPFEERTTFYVKDQYPEELKPLVAEILLEPGFFREIMPMDGAREVVVKTIGSDRNLRYVDWVRRNREYVAGKTGGRIGGSPGMVEPPKSLIRLP